MQNQDKVQEPQPSVYIGGGCNGQLVLNIIGALVVTVVVLWQTPAQPYMAEFLHHIWTSFVH